MLLNDLESKKAKQKNDIPIKLIKENMMLLNHRVLFSCVSLECLTVILRKHLFQIASSRQT